MLKNYFKKFTPYDPIIWALMLALQIVLARFIVINFTIAKLTVELIPVALTAMMYGFFPAMLVSALGDIIGAFLFPSGPYFPGFTLTAALMGLVFGLFLNNIESCSSLKALVKIAAANFTNQFILSLLLNTYWISKKIIGQWSVSLFTLRFASSCLDLLVHTAIIFFLYNRHIPERLKRLRKN